MLYNVRQLLFSTFFFEFNEIDNVAKIRNIFREFIFYAIFVILATIVILSNTSNFWFTHIMKNEFIDDEFDTMYPSPISILEVRNLEETWKAMENILFESVYWRYWYKKPNVTKLERMKLYLIGVPRLRQLRVKKVQCKYTEVRRTHEYCYHALSKSTMDTEPFGLKNSSAWTYSSSEKLDDVSYSGIMQTYDGGGYYQDFNTNDKSSFNTFCSLKDNLWLDRQSRAVFIDFTIYNANINVFIIIKIAFELPPTGGVVVSYRLHNVKILTLVNKYDFFILGFEMICFLYLFYYTICLVLNIRLHKMKFFSSRWNRLDACLIFLGYIYMLICIYSSIITSHTLRKIIKNPDSHVNFEQVGYCFGHLDTIMSILMLLIYVKLFKYIELNKTLGLLNATMRKAVKDLAAFIIVFMIVFLTFAILGYHLFGSQLHDFSTVAISIFTLVKSLGGEFNYFDLQVYYEYVAPVYFILFIFIVFFVLLNMFLGIISDAYATMKCDVGEKRDYEIPNFLNRGPRRLFKRCPKIANYFPIIENTDRLPIIKKLLAEALYGTSEIDLFFNNYEMKKDITYTDETEFKEELKKFQFEIYESAEYIKMINNVLTYMSAENVELYEQSLTELENKIAILNGLVYRLDSRITRGEKIEQLMKGDTAEKASHTESTEKIAQLMKEDTAEKPSHTESTEKIEQVMKEETAEKASHTENIEKNEQLIKGETAEEASHTENPEKIEQLIKGETAEKESHTENTEKIEQSMKRDTAEKASHTESTEKIEQVMKGETAEKASHTENTEKIEQLIKGETAEEASHTENTKKIEQLIKGETAEKESHTQNTEKIEQSMKRKTTEKASHTENTEKIEQLMKGETAEKESHTENAEKIEQLIKGETAEKESHTQNTEKIEQSMKRETTEKASHTENPEKIEQSMKRETTEIESHTENTEKIEQLIKGETTEKASHTENTEKIEQSMKRETAEKASHTDNTEKNPTITESKNNYSEAIDAVSTTNTIENEKSLKTEKENPNNK